jgi:hypothetical protein
VLFFLGTLVLTACGPVVTSARPPALATTTPPAVSTSTPPTAVSPTSAPVCQPNQLAGQFRAGGLATGNVIAELLVRNMSPSACTLQGRVDFYGTDAQGQRIAPTKMNQPQTLAPTVLPPDTPVAPPLVEPTAGAYLVLPIIGFYRDDPTAANGLCSTANEVTPSQFVIVVGAVSLHVANYDPAGRDFKAMYGCHGLIVGQGASLASP